MSLFIQQYSDSLVQLCQKYDVKEMYLFGSSLTKNFNEKSDIDVLITFKKLSFDVYTDNYFNLHQELEDLFQRKVDLLTDKSLQNPYFIQSINQTKKLIYAA